jgi:transcriptional regulator GlxA family with amidase domain
VMRAHLEGVLFELLEAIEVRGVIDAHSLRELEARALRTLAVSRGIQESISAFRNVALGLARVVREPSAASQDARLERAKRFIEQNLSKPLRLPAVAQQAGFSPSHFSALFRRRVGLPFERYLTERRLYRARELLLTTGLTVGAIKAEVGFASDAGFFGAFRATFGASPAVFRRDERAID